MRPRCPSGMPGPRSSIVTTQPRSLTVMPTSTADPSGEKLIALATRFSNTCASRSREPRTRGTSPGVSDNDSHVAPVGHLKPPGELAQQLRRDRPPRWAPARSVRQPSRLRGGPTPAAPAGRRRGCSSARNRWRSASRSATAIISAAVRIDARGFLNSCDTSAANDPHKLDVIVDAARHLLERARERADLVGATRFGKTSRQRRAAIRQCRRAGTKPPQRTDNRHRRQRGQNRRRHHRCHDDAEDPQPDVVQRLQDAERGLRHEHGARDGWSCANRLRTEHRHRSLSGRRPCRRSVPAGESRLHFRLGTSLIRGTLVSLRRHERSRSDRLSRIREPRADAIEHAVADVEGSRPPRIW